MAQNSVKVGGLYKHYKGNLYRVHSVAKHSETLEELVIYEALYANPEGAMWARPLKMFCENITINGQEVPRFALQS